MLNHKITVYVTSTIAGNIPASPDVQERWVNAFLANFSKWFGGATVIDGVGAWMSDTFGLVKEPIKLVYAFMSQEAYAQHGDDVFALASAMRADMGQEAVSVEVDGELNLVSAEPKIRVAS